MREALRNFYVSHLPKFLHWSMDFVEIVDAYHFEGAISISEAIESRWQIIRKGYVKNADDFSLLVKPFLKNVSNEYSKALADLFNRHIDQFLSTR